MVGLLPLLAPLAGPAIALVAGLAGWRTARAFAPPPAANDNRPRLPHRLALPIAAARGETCVAADALLRLVDTGVAEQPGDRPPPR